MWLTYENIQELNWKQAVDKLHKIFKGQNKQVKNIKEKRRDL